MCMYRNCKHRNRGGFSAEAVSTGSLYRLSRHVLPQHYDLELTPDFDNLTFFGSVGITVKVKKASQEIVVNAHDLKIGKAMVVRPDGTTLNATVSLDEKLQRATLKFDGVVGKGIWKIVMTFAGTLNDELKGFYRSTWKDAAGVEHVIATTQFEATDARRAFPCFDEPDMKATFKVTMNVPHGYTALSCMRAEAESTMSVETPAEFAQSGIKMMEPRLLKRVEFATTPKMSTYYLAFVAGELALGGTVKVRGVDLNFWTIPGSEHQLEFAKRVGAFAYSWLEDYCQTKYIGDTKIDFLAIPDFAAGAMENLGCIIYRMTDLLLNEQTATQGERERVAHVVTHELVHMRFGDDATMAWWDNLWLNESFATLLEYMGVDAMFPEWKTWETFAGDRASAFGLDQLHSTHPIQVPVENPFQIDEIFDLISYEKGCATLRMIEQTIGPDTFREGVRIYLKRHHLANTVEKDLWKALAEGCAAKGVDINVIDLTEKWVFTAGHPLVTVSASKLPGFIKLEQKEFKVLPGEGKSPVWPIPVKLRANTAGGIVEQSFIFDKVSEEVYVGEGLTWVVVNADGNGFYRVKYDDTLIGRLLPVVKTVMGPVEQYNLINDAWGATRACEMSVHDFLRLGDYMVGSKDPNVWECIARSLGYLHSVLSGTAREAVSAKARTLFKPLYAKLGAEAAEDETDTKVMELRCRVLRTLGLVGNYQPVIDKARQTWLDWKKDPESVDSDIFDAMLDVACAHGDVALYDELDKLRTTAGSPQEQEKFLMALTGFTDKDLVERSLNLVIGGGIRVQDAVFFLSGLLGEEQSSARVWQVTKDNWTKIKAMWPEAMVGRLYGSLGVLDTPEEEADVKAFFDANPVETTKMQLAQGLEKLRINVRLRQSVSAGETALMQYLVPSGQQGCIPPSVKDGGKGVDSAEDAAPAPAAQAPSDASPAVSSEAAPAAGSEKSDK